MAIILVIDDDPKIRRLLRLILQQQGHEIVEAGDGAEGLHVARQRRIDLVFCDLLMPVKDGIEMIREFCQEYPGVPLVAMSGGAFGGRLNLLPAALQLGACRALAKPFIPADVLAAVEGALGSTPH